MGKTMACTFNTRGIYFGGPLSSHHSRNNAVRRFAQPILLCVLACAGVVPAEAQVFGLDRHTVTIQVVPITDVQIVGGGVTLDINNATAVAGQDKMTITDQSSSIRWATNSANRKITVATDLAVPIFTLRVQAIGPSQGVAAPEVTLTTTATDLLLNIGRSMGTAGLRYTGIAYASQGTGTDSHVVTFTIQTQ